MVFYLKCTSQSKILSYLISIVSQLLLPFAGVCVCVFVCMGSVLFRWMQHTFGQGSPEDIGPLLGTGHGEGITNQ